MLQDIISLMANEAIFGDIGTLYSANKTYRTSIVDIEISDDNLINCLDYTSVEYFNMMKTVICYL